MSELPAGRYAPASRPRWKSRSIYWSLLAAFIVAGLVVAYLGYRNLGNGPIDAEVSAFTVTNDHTVTVRFTVTRDHPDQPVDCILRALATDQSEVGRREVYVPAGTDNQQLSTQLRTDERATTAEFYGCSYQVPGYLTNQMPPSG